MGPLANGSPEADAAKLLGILGEGSRELVLPEARLISPDGKPWSGDQSRGLDYAISGLAA